MADFLLSFSTDSCPTAQPPQELPVSPAQTKRVVKRIEGSARTAHVQHTLSWYDQRGRWRRTRL